MKECIGISCLKLHLELLHALRTRLELLHAFRTRLEHLHDLRTRLEPFRAPWCQDQAFYVRAFTSSGVGPLLARASGLSIGRRPTSRGPAKIAWEPPSVPPSSVAACCSSGHNEHIDTTRSPMSSLNMPQYGHPIPFAAGRSCRGPFLAKDSARSL